MTPSASIANEVLAELNEHVRTSEVDTRVEVGQLAALVAIADRLAGI